MSEISGNLIYLDHNIVQYCAEGKLTLPKIENCIYVYSNIHFEEYSRWPDPIPRYFDILNNLKARHIRIGLDDNYNLTDNIIIRPFLNSEELYQANQATISDVPDTSQMWREMMVKFNGASNAPNAKEFSDVLYENLIALYDQGFNEIDDSEAKEYRDEMNDCLIQLRNDFESTISEAESQMVPLDKQRKKLKAIRLSELNSKNGCIIDQIWEQIKTGFPNQTKDQWFGKKMLLNERHGAGGDTSNLFNGVVKCHSMLNSIGYYPDQGLAKVNKITGISSDGAHLGLAAYCQGLITADDRMHKKATVIYSYFERNTVVFKVNPIGDNV